MYECKFFVTVTELFYFADKKSYKKICQLDPDSRGESALSNLEDA